MKINYYELIFVPFVRNYLFVCFLFSVIYKNIELPQTLSSFKKNLKPYLFIFPLFSIPFIQWYSLAFKGSYISSDVFIFDLLAGLIIFYIFSRVHLLKFKKRKILVLIISMILSFLLIILIWSDTAFIMTFP